MEEVPENGKESSHSALANGMNVLRNFSSALHGRILASVKVGTENTKHVPHRTENWNILGTSCVVFSSNSFEIETYVDTSYFYV